MAVSAWHYGDHQIPDARVGRLDERSKHWLLNLRLKLTKFFGEWPVAQTLNERPDTIKMTPQKWETLKTAMGDYIGNGICVRAYRR
jgi:hypothetical protein